MPLRVQFCVPMVMPTVEGSMMWLPTMNEASSWKAPSRMPMGHCSIRLLAMMFLYPAMLIPTAALKTKLSTHTLFCVLVPENWMPVLLVVLAIGFGVPALRLPFVSLQSTAVYGTVALIITYSAYVSEVYRAGLNSVHRSQTAAARSLGLSQFATLRFVVLPQAVRNILPPLLNDFISLQKDTALVGVLGAIEANEAAQIYSSTVFNYSSYTVAALLFLLLTIPLARFTDRLIDRDRQRRLAGAAT